MNTTVDLRSDTVTRPTKAMREAIANAPVGDDSYGDDPSVNALERRIADMLGFEAAMFVASGTQSNLCAILAHCQRGDEYIVGQNAHCYRWEGGGAAVLGGVQPQPLEYLPDMTFDLDVIAKAIKPDDYHFARSRLFTLENTIGGRILPLDFIETACDLAAFRGLSRHLDGARLFNAAVAMGDGAAMARKIAGHFDTVSVCFSKGLGAPVGSALCGSAEFIHTAKRIRKLAGGAMRQAGIIAAAADYALQHNVDRLAEDHRRARILADGLAAMPGFSVKPVDTNIVFVGLDPDSGMRVDGLLAHLRAAGIIATGLYDLRFVTHMDVDDDGIARTLEAVETYRRTA